MKVNQEQADAVGGEEGDAVPVDMLGGDDGAGAQGGCWSSLLFKKWKIFMRPMQAY